MSEGNECSSNASREGMLRLGLQLGILDALEGPRIKKEQQKVRKHRVLKKKKAGGVSAGFTQDVVRQRVAQVKDDDIESINERFNSIFDELLTSPRRGADPAVLGRHCNSRSKSPLYVGSCLNSPGSPPVRGPVYGETDDSSASSGSSTHAYLYESKTTAERFMLESPLQPASPSRQAFLSPSNYLPIYNSPCHGSTKPAEAHCYRVRFDFWSTAELVRMQSYSCPRLQGYRSTPSFVVMHIEPDATPHDVVNCLLRAWCWENSHRYRLSVYARTHARSLGQRGLEEDGLSPRAHSYDGSAFCRHKESLPAMSQFGPFVGSQMLLEYDLHGDRWQWGGEVLDVSVVARADPLQAAVRVMEHGGQLPLQYAWQYRHRFCGAGEDEDGGEGASEDDGVMIKNGAAPGPSLTAGKVRISPQSKAHSIFLGRYTDREGEVGPPGGVEGCNVGRSVSSSGDTVCREADWHCPHHQARLLTCKEGLFY
jgi:hypothetical protein